MDTCRYSFIIRYKPLGKQSEHDTLACIDHSRAAMMDISIESSISLSCIPAPTVIYIDPQKLSDSVDMLLAAFS